MIHETNRRFLILPLIVIIGCLGSFPIAEHFLVQSQLQTTTTVTISYTDGQCTSNMLANIATSTTPNATASASVTPNATQTTSPTPNATQAASPTPNATNSASSSSSATTVPASLITVWVETHNTTKDYTNAQACAIAFANTYQTFDFQHLDSTTSALAFLSADAKKRFSEGYENISANPRTTEAWKQQIVTNQIVQTARASTPTLEGYIYQKNELFLNFDVPYQLTTSIKGVKSVTQTLMTVRLKKIQPDSSTSGLGWQVTDWRDNGETQ